MSDKFGKLLNQLTKLHPKYIDLSLKRLLNLLEKLNNPHLNLPPTIHIAGTNGKGSTLNYIYQILKENNYKINCYISPHLESIEERYIICNKKITKKRLFNVLSYIKKINSDNPITFFEITTAAAFYLFANSKADFTILETGLGGRLDATNVIKKTIIDIITPISLDHQEFLGKNIKKITNEKLGIIKPSSIIIIGKQNIIVKKHIKKKLINTKNKKLFFNSKYKIKIQNQKFTFLLNGSAIKLNKPCLNGKHQIENSAIALCTAFQVKKMGYKITKKSLINGLKNVSFPGRLEKFHLKNIPVFLDGAHNVAGADILYDFFKKNKKERWLIIGMMNNKDLENFLIRLKEIISGVIALKIPGEKNSFSTNKIIKICEKNNIICKKKQNIKMANSYLLNYIKPEEILVTGSLYLLGKVRKLYRK